MATNNKIMGYLPNDAPPLGQTILLGFQHVLTMFPATVLVAALCGFHVGTVHGFRLGHHCGAAARQVADR